MAPDIDTAPMTEVRETSRKLTNPVLADNEKIVFERPKALLDVPTHYCPGCQHGVAHRLVAELIDEMNLRERAILVSSIGCSVFMYDYMDFDAIEAPHGRGPAAATGIKRAIPDSFVMTYQGDGDLASIGMAEIMHAAARGENISVVFINNTVYGMTGGQMAPTTLLGQKTTTCKAGRSEGKEGTPVRMCELISRQGGTAYVARGALDTVKNIAQAKNFMRKAFEVQLKGLGMGFVELLSSCSTAWHLDPAEASRRITTHMIPYFPLGVYKDRSADAPEGDDGCSL